MPKIPAERLEEIGRALFVAAGTSAEYSLGTIFEADILIGT